MTPSSLQTRILWLAAAISLVAASLVTTVAAQDSTPATGDEPGFETFGALPWEEPPGAVPYVVWDVTDGDTITVVEPEQAGERDPWWEPVRMIGIDSPEKDGPYTDEECYGQEASSFLAELLPKGTTVYLQIDNDENIADDREIAGDGMELDDNDRWLAHVYVKADGTDDYYLVSEILALGGFVDVKDYGDNSYFADELFDGEKLARDEDRGLWSACAA